jgi:hypothetical protein
MTSTIFDEPLCSREENINFLYRFLITYTSLMVIGYITFLLN